MEANKGFLSKKGIPSTDACSKIRYCVRETGTERECESTRVASTEIVLVPGEVTVESIVIEVVLALIVAVVAVVVLASLLLRLHLLRLS